MRRAIFGVLFMLSVLDAAPCQLPNEPLLIGHIRRELPKGWECTLVREPGLKGHPHALNEPLFRVISATLASRSMGRARLKAR